MIEPRHGGQLLLATSDDPNGSALAVTEQLPSMKNATEHFLHHIDTSEDLLRLCQSGVCRDSQEILEAGRRSMKAGTTVLLPLGTS
jgi:predicted dehydrogenase